MSLHKHKKEAFLLLAAVLVNVATSTVVCPSCQSLQDLAADLKSRIPNRGSELYVAPSKQVMEDWENVVRGMMKGLCDNLKLPQSLTSHYIVETFLEGSHSYCVLAAVDSTPWGTVIVNNDDDGARPLSIDVPHPLYDANTLYEGITVFQGTHAKVYVLSGSHRHANDEASNCQSSFGIADAAHNQNTFLSSTAAIFAHYDSLGIKHTVVQLHGMGASTCPGVDVYLSHGLNLPPTDQMVHVRLRDALARRSDWTVTVPGDNLPCSMGATLNIQGRLLNGVEVDDLCKVGATDASGRFVHIEQKFHARNGTEFHGYIVDSINEIFFGNNFGREEGIRPGYRKAFVATASLAVIALLLYKARFGRPTKSFQPLSEVEFLAKTGYGSSGMSEASCLVTESP